MVFIAMSVCQQLAAAIERKDSIVNDSLTSSLTLFGYTSVKPVQLEAIHDLLSGKNVLVTVPTGYGKSFIYQVLPFCASSILNPSRCPGDVSTTVLVISPLVALMHDQVERLTIEDARRLLERVQAVLWLVQNPRAPPAT